MKKYQSVEETNVVSPKGHKTISNELQKTGKTSVSEMTPEEKKQLHENMDNKKESK
jgi:hypothetical protein